MKNTLPPAPAGYTWINIDSFIKKYIKGAIIPMDLFLALQQKLLDGATKVTITTSTIEMLDNLLAEKKAEDKRLLQCSSLNNKGSEYEKQGKINLAIKTYEKNIGVDCYPASHSFNRLMVLYRKEKYYDNEIRVINRAIDVFSVDSHYSSEVYKWRDRLEKVNQLKNKLK
ncbi:hypothetical protein FACS189451_09250 [Bacteroidia bacterium]|nr:hypothetical protein FACS189451_09250 [Bacteroidia bacterium]